MKGHALGVVVIILAMTARARSEEPTLEAMPEALPKATIDRAVERFRRGDYVAALPLLARSHAAHPTNLDVTLLFGITYFRLHQEERAEPLLRSAASSDNLETAASARIFLGLLLQREGATDVAESYLQRSVAMGGPLADSGKLLLHRLRAPRVELLLLLRPEFDSNVRLYPAAPTAISGDGQRADGDLLALVSLRVRPFRSLGIVLEEIAAYRQQFTLLDYSIFSSTTGAQYAYLGRSDRVNIGYGFEVLTLGGALLNIGHVVSAEYRRRIVRELGIAASYTFHYRSYYPIGYQAFTGPTHAGLVELNWGTSERRLEMGAGYLVTREETADPSFAAIGQGAALRLRARFARIFELACAGSAQVRVFDAPDPIDGATNGVRRDTQLFADLSLSVDASRHLGFVVGGSVLRNLSTIPDFDYLKVTAHFGLVFGYAGP